VENLVKYVKGNFLAGRNFYDDLDLTQQNGEWLHLVNEVRVCSATEQIPSVRLTEERRHFGVLPAAAMDYGFFDSVLVNRESLVIIETNRYSVPVHLVGQTLTARLHLDRINLYDGVELVANHPRQRGRHARVVVPAHFEAIFARKPRARVMVYRDWLVALSPTVATYIGQVCHKYYSQMETQIVRLYTLAQEVGTAEFVAAVTLASEQQAIGVEYVSALVRPPTPLLPAPVPLPLSAWRVAPPQSEVERALADYERYVANPVEVAHE
jgi:hypothetical protein